MCIYIYSIIQYIYLCIQYICNLMAPSHVVGDSNNYRNFNAIVCYNITDILLIHFRGIILDILRSKIYNKYKL